LTGPGGGQQTPQVAQEETTPTVPPTATPPIVNVIVADRDIPRGARLNLSDVTIVAFPDDPANPLPPTLLTVGDGEDEGLGQVEGRVARTDIISGQPIQDFMLTPGDEPIDLVRVGSDATLRIPSGFVAITLPITNVSSVSYLLREGDHVDILASYRFVDVDQEFQSELGNRGATVTLNPETNVITLQSLDEFIRFYDPGDDLPDERYAEEVFFDSSLLIIPSESQRPRQSTQLIIDNAVVLHVGTAPLLDLYQPIVVTQEIEPTAEPVPEEEAAQPPPEEEAEPTPTPTQIPPPLTATLIMTRQDALVLKYSLEIGADIDLVLRSALDDNITDIATDTVTLNYILDVYGVDVPDPLEVATDPRVDFLSFGEPSLLGQSFFNLFLDANFDSIDTLDPTGPTGP
ncbi:MAG: SAF domain-containing protein, partial [Anaerolineae bacterium]